MYTRRSFIRSSTLATAALLAGNALASPIAGKRKLSFSTLGCPDWSLDEIMAFAVKNKYQGLEFRGLLREMELYKCKEFADAAAIRATKDKLKDHRLSVVNLGSSCTLHFANGQERSKQLEQGKKFIDLAHELQCPFIRVFPNNFPKDQTREQTMDLIASGLKELAVYGKEAGVKVLMETHGELVHTADLEAIMKMTGHPNAGLLWDFCNMWSVTREEPALMYRSLKPYIHHTHIKDARIVNGQPQYVFLGQGEVPIFQAVDLLSKNNFPGYYSFEWEKLWHPELEAPELALADYPKAMTAHFQ